MSEIKHNGRIVRVNRFTVPGEARAEFIRLLERTHAVMRRQPGFVEDLVLEQPAGAGIVNLITIIQFEGEHVLQPIIAAVALSDRQEGIDRQALSRQLGVESNVGFYAPLALRELAPA